MIPNLNDKDRYIVHQKTLKQYLDLGLRIKKIHRGTSFEEETWLKSYIDFEKDFFKLMNNSVFAKTVENIKN